MGAATEDAIRICRAVLKTKAGRNPDDLVQLLHRAISTEHAGWAEHQKVVQEELGTVADGIDPPLDVVSYLLDFALPAALQRLHPFGIERNHELRHLVKDLTSEQTCALLVVYAAVINDRCAMRRAWDVFTNPQSPYHTSISQFQMRRKGGLARSNKDLEQRDITIWTEFQQMRRFGKSRALVVQTLAKRNGLTPERIGQIVRKFEMR